MIRIGVFAYSLVGYLCLKALIDQQETVSGVFTHPDALGENLWFPSVEKLARENGIPVIAAAGPDDPRILAALQETRPELLFSFYYRKMIPGKILQIPEKGSFNMHGSLLPRYRGRAPVNWALVHGEKETGATLHHMVKSADAGNIVDQEAVPIRLADTAYEVTHKVGAAAVRILCRQLPALKEGCAPSIPQDNTQATCFGGRTAKDSLIDWQASCWQIHNLIRAVPYPYYPPAFTYFKGQKIEIHRHCLPDENPLTAPAERGQVVAKGDKSIRVACGNGQEFIEIMELSVPLEEISTGDIWGI